MPPLTSRVIRGSLATTDHEPIIRLDAQQGELICIDKVQARNEIGYMRIPDLTTGEIRFTLQAGIRDEGGAFTDQTAECNSAALGDVTVLRAAPASGDAFYLGWDKKFSRVEWGGAGGPAGNTVVLEYWNGAWTALGGITDDTSDMDTDGRITWTVPADWVTTTINGQGPFYYIRQRWSSVAGGGPVTMDLLDMGDQILGIFDSNVRVCDQYYDQLNPSAPSDAIYVAAAADHGGNPTIQFMTLDPTTGDITLPVQVDILASILNTGNGWGSRVSTVEGGNNLSVCRAASGRIYICYNDPRQDIDFGVAWMSDQTTAPYTSFTNIARPNLLAADRPDRIRLLPDPDAADPEDILCVNQDVTNEFVGVQRYDQSLNAWGAPVKATGADGLMGASENVNQKRATVFQDAIGDIYLAVTNENGSSTYHSASGIIIRAFKWDNSAGTWSELNGGSPIYPSGVGHGVVALAKLPSNGQLVLVYSTGNDVSPPPGNPVEGFESLDDGATWQAMTQIDDGTGFNRFGAFWIAPPTANSGDNFIFGYSGGAGDFDLNYLNSPIEVTAPDPPPPPPPEGVPVATLCDFGYEFDELIDPAGIVFRLSDGLGKHLLVESGTGLPPINYLTQRAPYVDGEQLFDYRLQARSVRQTYRHRGKNRSDRWRLYGFLIDALRPNRQVAPWQVVQTLRLRKYLPDGSRWDLNVMPDLAPMGQRRSAGWDEWSLQEAIRFIAFDPVYFDPDQTVVTLTDSDEQLEFGDDAQGIDGGVDFEPGERIWFGGGLTATVVYDGNWFAQPVIEITGPVTDPIITNDSIVERIALDYAIEAGEVVTIDTREASRSVVSGLVGSITGLTLNPSTLATFRLEPEPTAPGGENPIRLFGTDIVEGQTAVTVRYQRRKIALGQ